MRKLLLTVGLLGSVVCTAQGADLPTKALSPAPAPSCFASATNCGRLSSLFLMPRMSSPAGRCGVRASSRISIPGSLSFSLGDRSRSSRSRWPTFGGGAFGNHGDWIHDAMVRALGAARKTDLDVRLVSFGAPSSGFIKIRQAGRQQYTV
jgi:hypothetical protein